MPTFEEFVQTELPTRPFTATDGLPGQVPVRSSDPQRVRELVWTDIPGIGTPSNHIQLEAGADMLAGTPVKVSGNLLQPADCATDPQIVGLLRQDATAGHPATAVTSGTLAVSGLVPGAPYYLRSGAIAATPPTSGYLIRIGQAVTASLLLINIEEPILLGA